MENVGQLRRTLVRTEDVDLIPKIPYIKITFKSSRVDEALEILAMKPYLPHKRVTKCLAVILLTIIIIKFIGR